MKIRALRTFTTHNRIFDEGREYEVEKRTGLSMKLIELSKRGFCEVLETKKPRKTPKPKRATTEQPPEDGSSETPTGLGQ